MNRKILGAYLVVGVLGAGVATTAVAHDTSTTEAATTIEGFFSAQQSSYVPAARAKAAQAMLGSAARQAGFTKVVSARDSANAKALTAFTATELRAQEAVGRVNLTKFATNAALNQSVSDHEKTIKDLATATGFRALGGGANNAKVLTLRHRGSELDVTASVTTWSLFAEKQDSGIMAISRPQNVLLVKATLVPGPSGLLVSKYTWTFAPGSTP